jgi:integrase/recombinase XerD
MSTLLSAVKDYVRLRQSLGFKLHQEARLLSDFVSFLEAQGASYITTELAVRWAVQSETALPSHRARRLRAVRLFAKHWSATDPRTEVPPPGLLPDRYHRKPPHIFTRDEIRCLVEAAWRLRTHRGLRPWTYATVLGLVAVTGMRAGEVIHLDRDDVDLDRGILCLRLTKFGKSRLIPVHSSTQCALRDYARRREQIIPRPQTPSFFLSDQGRRLKWSILRWTFVQLAIQCGLRTPTARRGPRLHDLRHTFAVRTLLDWYRNGADVEKHLPQLSTYLGHVHVSDTFWYLSAVPELLALVTARLDGPSVEGQP